MILEEAQEALRQFHIRTGATHYHSSLSVLPILLAIKDKMRPEDVCILSKAHAITAYLLVFDKLPETSPVQSEFGALGSALSFALGVAYMKPDSNIYVICGDGEMQSGANLEALRAIPRLGINNVEVHIDGNGMQGMMACPQSSGIPMYWHATDKGPSWECHYWSAK
jgi:transketolase N-terminal domain/subunit